MTSALFWERYHPLFSGAGGGALTFVLLRCVPVEREPLTQVFSSTVDVGAIGIGFLATALSVLLSLSTSKVVETMQATGMYDLVLEYLLSAVRWAFFLAGLSLLNLVAAGPFRAPALLLDGAIILWASVLTASAVSAYRIVRIFFRILNPKDKSGLGPR